MRCGGRRARLGGASLPPARAASGPGRRARRRLRPLRGAARRRGAETGAPAFDTARRAARARPARRWSSIATPPDSHARAVPRGARGGRARDLREAVRARPSRRPTRCSRAAAAAGRQVAVNHEYREKPIFRAVQERIGAADVGRLVFVPDLAAHGPRARGTSRWPGGAAMPNRTLFEGGVHLVDLMLQLYGRAARGRLRAALERARPRARGGRDPPRHARVPRRRASAQITIDRLCQAGTRYVELRADCEHASLRASHGGRALLQAGTEARRAARRAPRLRARRGSRGWSAGTTRKTIARNPRDPGVDATRDALPQDRRRVRGRGASRPRARARRATCSR